jgi:hypothetical protein
MSISHHAYLCFGDSVTVVPESVQQPGIDIEHYHVPQWGIADSRRLTEAAQQRPVQAPQRTFVVVTKSLTTEAQNALLKLLEEPPGAAQFYVVVPNPECLLETVRSRLLPLSSVSFEHDGTAWEDLCTQDLATQLAICAERAKEKDVNWQRSVLAAAVNDLRLSPEVRLLIETYQHFSGASRKMLLEEVLLSLASSSQTRYNAVT